MTNLITPATLPAAVDFEKTIGGKATKLYILKNSNGAQAAITNYGGRLVSMLVPDSSGNLIDVVAGPGAIADFETSAGNYYGALIGRYGNRIGAAKFTLDGQEYVLDANNGPNTLHGGKEGFDRKIWDAVQVNDHTLELKYLSLDGEEGFPGNLNVTVTYKLTGDNGLEIHYHAVTDKTTLVNLTNHAYFNLNGGGTILDHSLQINAEQYVPIDDTSIPLGEPAPVEGTPFDFRQATAIGARIHADDIQLTNGNGYDHTFVFEGNTLHTPVTTAVGDKTGIKLEVFTTEPGMQLYTGNFMLGQHNFKGGAKDEFRTAFALETQHYPDSPNKPHFPTTVLKPGEVYETTTVYKFSME